MSILLIIEINNLGVRRNNTIFVIQGEDIAYFKTQIDSCADAFSRFSLEKEIDAYNKEIYDFAVKEVALSVNPISSLVDIVEV